MLLVDLFENRIHLDFDTLYGKTFKVVDNSGNPNLPGFSIVTPSNSNAWTDWKERPEFKKVVKQKLNDPSFLGDHKYKQIIAAMGINEDAVNEYRDKMFQYLKSIVPTWPDYIIRDWLYANFAKGPTQGPGWSFANIKSDLQNIFKDMGLSVNTKWQLVPNMKFTMDMWEPVTLKRLQARAGGNSKPTDPSVHVPARDAERHTTQAALAKQQGGVRKEPVIIIKTSNGYELLEGWHRTIQHFKQFPNGYVGPAYVASQRITEDATSDLANSLEDKKVTSYKAIDAIMQKIAKDHNITANELHDRWVKKYNKTPDDWIKEKLSEAKVTLYTDPKYFGADVSDNAGEGLSVQEIPLNKLVGFEPDNKMQDPKSAAKMSKMVELLKAGKGKDLPPILVRKYKDGYQVLDGHHRFHAYKKAGMKTIPGKVVPDKDIELKENFADGKNPGRKGLAKRSGVNTKASVSSLRKTAKNSTGEKQRMAHWLANMKSGKKK